MRNLFYNIHIFVSKNVKFNKNGQKFVKVKSTYYIIYYILFLKHIQKTLNIHIKLIQKQSENFLIVKLLIFCK